MGYILGIDSHFIKIEHRKKFSPKVGYIDFEIDLFSESDDEQIIIAETYTVDKTHNQFATG